MIIGFSADTHFQEIKMELVLITALGVGGSTVIGSVIVRDIDGKAAEKQTDKRNRHHKRNKYNFVFLIT